mgnify:CR=1 FL=1
MRCSEVKAKIVETIEGVTVDNAVGARDRLVYVDTGGREIQGSPDRLFRVILQTVPHRAPFLTLDAFLAEFGVDVHYVASKNVEDRVASDAEKINTELVQLHTTDNEIYSIEVTPGSVTETDGLMIAHTDCVVTYRLTGV